MAEPQILRQRERDLAARAKREEQAKAARRKRIIRSGGQVLEADQGPDTLGGAAYDVLGRIAGGFQRLTGASERDAMASRRRTEGAARDVGEFVVGPEELERSATRVARGRGGAEDYAVLGLTVMPLPGVVRRGAKGAVKRVVKPVAKAAERAGKSRVGRYLTESRAVPETDAPAPRAKYERRAEGPFTVIRRKGAVAETDPELLNAKNIDELRVPMRDPARNPALRAASEASMEARGVPLTMDEPLPTTSLRRQAGIGRAYQAAVEGSPEYKSALFERYGEMLPEVVEQAGAQNLDQLTEAAYQSLAADIPRQFDRLPVEMRYHSGEGEYATPSAMFKDVLGRGRLNVFSGGEPHEFLDRIDPETGLSLNEMFRAVHDYYGHVAPGSTFRPGGEEIAYATHARTMSPLSQMALLSETRGQNSFVNYSPTNARVIGEMNRVRNQITEVGILEKLAASGKKDAAAVLNNMPSRADLNAQLRQLGEQFQYAQQRAVLLPPEYLDPMSPGGVPDWLQQAIPSRAPINEQRGVHFSPVEGLTEADPSFYGRGHQGEDYRRVRAAGGPERTHLYVGPTGTVNPEEALVRRGLATNAYEAQLGNLYDVQQDPENLAALSRAYNLPGYESSAPFYLMKDAPLRSQSAIPDFERLVQDYGYSGYLSDFGRNRAAAVFEPVRGLRPITAGPEGYAEGGAVHASGNGA